MSTTHFAVHAIAMDGDDGSFTFSFPQPERSGNGDFEKHPLSADVLFLNGHLLPFYQASCNTGGAMDSILSSSDTPFMEDARQLGLGYRSQSSRNPSHSAPNSLTKSASHSINSRPSFRWSFFSLTPLNPSHIRGVERRLTSAHMGVRAQKQERRNCNQAGHSNKFIVKKEEGHAQKSWKMWSPFYVVWSGSSYIKHMLFGDCKEASTQVAVGIHVLRPLASCIPAKTQRDNENQKKESRHELEKNATNRDADCKVSQHENAN